jgi:hypothetical protein
MAKKKLFFFPFALLLAGCSFSEEAAEITGTISNIPAAADHLDVFLCFPAVASCTADNATRKYRPSFQPGALSPPSIDVAFAPVPDGTYSVAAFAFDHTNPTPSAGAFPLAKGSFPGGVAPTLVTFQITLQ